MGGNARKKAKKSRQIKQNQPPPAKKISVSGRGGAALCC